MIGNIGMYDEGLIAPMRKELTDLGVKQLLTPEEVDKALRNQKESSLVIVSSVCGCAAGKARPGIALALRHQKLPARLYTVFAGQDRPATERARTYFNGYPPSSLQIALLKDGKVVFMLERRDIENKEAPEIAEKLAQAFDKFV